MDKEDYSVILFDGVCNLCNSSVNFIIDRDKRRIFRYATQQSESGQAYLKSYDLQTDTGESIILIEQGTVYIRSSAALRIAKKMDGAWPLMYIFMAVPRFIRDPAYNIIAKNRYKWFGRTEECRVPTPELQELFLP
jgi:predicted DCC family thiol-disulfide oxidoreductase YuxK